LLESGCAVLLNANEYLGVEIIEKIKRKIMPVERKKR
jgi:hypothetical protein